MAGGTVFDRHVQAVEPPSRYIIAPPFTGSEKRIPADSVDDAFVSRLAEFMRKMTSDMPPRRVPSLAECGWCELTSADCPDRVEPGLN